MYAVFKTGGKQYRAAKGDRLKIEKLDAVEGDSIEFEEVLLVGEGQNIKFGTPLVSDGKVSGKIIAQARDKKVDVIKFKRRQNYRRSHGHRQSFTLVEITGVKGGTSKELDSSAESDKQE
ncbi:MAG: 50S ribosomal protein L21 [Pseudomonadota bacterium]|nr:50S ribosomal protein L21 [Pseudomonadota bacterium]